MKKFIILLFCVVFWGCPGHGLNQKFPKHDLRISSSFIQAEQDNYYLFTGHGRVISDGYVNEKDTLTIGDSLYTFVFFAKIVPNKLHKEYDDIPSSPLLHKLYVRGVFIRKPIPGYGNREFAVVEDVVGVQ